MEGGREGAAAGGKGKHHGKKARRHMDLTQKYHLIELLPGEGVQSYRARQTNTGREVTVHLLVGGKTPENEATVARLRAMQPQSMAKLIEVGEQQGTTFVVTVAPPFQRLDAWLAEQDRVAAVAKEFGKATVWKRPAVGSLVPPAPLRPAATPSTEPGEFTRMFQSPVAPPPTEPVVPPASAATTQFTLPPPPAPLRPAATPSTEPGEFTRMFQSPVAPPAEPVAPPASAATRQFTPPPPPAPLRPAATPSTEPGAFTRMFQSPVAPPPAEPVVPPARARGSPSKNTKTRA